MLEKIKILLEKHKNEIIDILKEIEVEKVAIEEYNLSIKALNNNKKYVNGKINAISSYMPMNLPLYSLMIYAIIPKLCAKKSIYRPSSKTSCQSKKIHKILELDKYNINLFDGTRFDYLKREVSNSDVVVFIGKPENADELSKKISKNTMFIYFGVGQNPVVLTDGTDLNLASKKIAETIMFNYGQDCAKPNIILCKKTLYKSFLERLIAEIEKNMEQKTTIKNLDALRNVANLLIKNINYIEYGGNINFKEQTLNPVIITKNLSESLDNYDEFYAPIFRIMLYDDINELKKYFSSKTYKEENMNISLFGKSDFINNLASSLILYNEMVPEIDNGYCEYGGYGEKTSYLLYKGIKIVKPILINREIEYFFNNSSPVHSFDKLKNVSVSKNKLELILLEEYKSYIQNLFKSNMEFSFIFGSYAKGTHKMTSDIDMFVCLRESNKELEKKFREWYFKFHYIYGKIPDFYYPGELITEEKLNNIITNNKNLEIKLKNDADTFDALFYTQILTDKKRKIIGNQALLFKFEHEFKKIIPTFCSQIYNLLKQNNMIRDDRDNMKCLIAMANNDLLFFSKMLKFDAPKDEYAEVAEKLDDGFFIKCLKRQQKMQNFEIE